MIKITYKQITIILVSLVVLICLSLLAKRFLFAGDKTAFRTSTAASMEESRRAAEIRVATNRLNRLNTLMKLYQALGGDMHAT